MAAAPSMSQQVCARVSAAHPPHALMPLQLSSRLRSVSGGIGHVSCRRHRCCCCWVMCLIACCVCFNFLLC
jgi:hypothetical protein